MTTDLHAHAVPAGLLRMLQAGSFAGVELARSCDGIGLMVGGRAMVVGPTALADMAGRLAAMDAAGVRRQVLSCWIELLATRLDVRDARRWAAAVNDGLAEDVAAHPDRLDALGCVPLQSPIDAAAELRRLVEDLGLAGVEVPTTVAGAELADAGLEDLWATAEELRAIVVLHPVEPIGVGRMGGWGLSDLIGSPAETATAVGHLLRAGVLDRHPDLQVVLVHGGGVLPWLVGRAGAVGEAREEPALTQLASALRRMHHDSLVHDPRVLRLLLDVVGTDRVVTGTDWPFAHGERDPVGLVGRALPDAPSARAAVLEDNADRLLDGVRRPGRVESTP